MSVIHDPGSAHRQFEFDPFDDATIADPYPSYRTLRDAFPVYHNPQREIWAISRAEDVNALMRDWERCTSSLGMDLDGTGMMYPQGNFLNYDPPDHDVLRKVEILGLAITCYVASSEPVSNFITTSLDVLARHPDARAALFAGAAEIPATAIEELLRFESPLQNMARTTTVPIQLHGIEIPQGALLALLLGSANRDERSWEDADVLDLHRPARRHIAFGEGVHYCLGAPLARLQGRIALQEIARRLPEYEITGPVVRLGKVNSRGMESLPIAF